MPEKKSQLSQAKDDFEAYLRKRVDGARALRDELKLQAHLGTEEAKAHWADLERYLAHLDGVAHDLNRAAGTFGEQLLSLMRSAAPKRSAKRSVKSAAKRAGKAVKRSVKSAAKRAKPAAKKRVANRKSRR